MKKLLSLMLSLGLIISFAGCSKDDEDKKEPKEKVVVEPKEGMEKAYEEFLENIEEGNYYYSLDEDDEIIEAEVYSDGTYITSITEDGEKTTVVCGVDGEYSVDASEDWEDYFADEDLEELCEDEASEVEYEYFLDDLDLLDIFEEDFEEDLKDDVEMKFEDEDDFYVVTVEDDEEKFEFVVYKDGKKIEVMADGFVFVLEVL